jgi:phosphopantothenate synthetase
MLIVVAGPYSAETEEKKAANLKAMNKAAAEVYKLGHTPVIGVNAALLVADELADLNRHEVINNISFAVVERCDAILMIGSSKGADTERDIIKAKGLPVYYSIDEIPKAVKA